METLANAVQVENAEYANAAQSYPLGKINIDVEAATKIFLADPFLRGVSFDDNLENFLQSGAMDVLKRLGEISKEEHDYYDAL